MLLDTLIFHINGQNACVIFRKRATEVIYEAFEVMFPNENVMGAIGKLISSFPGPVIAVPPCHSALESGNLHHSS